MADTQPSSGGASDAGAPSSSEGSHARQGSGSGWLRSLTSLSGPRVVLLLVVVSGLGAAIDLVISGEPAEVFSVAFVTGSILAAVLARRSALFVAGVQPPLAFLGYGLVFSLLLRDSAGQGLLTSVAVDTALWMTTWFPVLAAATVPAVVIAVAKAWYFRLREPAPTAGRAQDRDSTGSAGATRGDSASRTRTGGTQPAAAPQ